MKKSTIFFVVLMFLFSCAEKLIKKPDNLIPRDKMVEILKEMTILNAAKSTNLGILKDNGIEPTTYVFEKFDVDSIQFVESDRYYASLPQEYEAIYKEVESLLEAQKKRVEEIKKINDSLKLIDKEYRFDKLKDSLNLPKN
ncbi:DUF4296 domain-containing protein [Maribacter aestuarii]|uniref:DUF4296 domain-containing protein n=1 Tax=Maribacter aestuarii TaxID=1130723 RepID=UPI00248CB3B1|nr:DUF4296 domain-containing protein [Maribacter aestuarii]